MEQDRINQLELQDRVRDLNDRYERGLLSLEQLAGALTHMNFDERFTEAVAHTDRHLSHIIEDIGPDLEYQPSSDLIQAIAHEISCFV